MKKHWIIALFLLPGLAGLLGQSISGDIESYLNSLVEIIPGSSGDLFSPPTPEELFTWRTMILNVLTDEMEEARVNAELLNYKITEIEDNSTDPSARYYVVEEKNPQIRYWGTFVFNLNSRRPQLVIQAPHPAYDLNTGYQGIFCFKRLGARALFFSGAHRCNHSGFTDCSGSTTACGGVSEPYRVSDNAHNTGSAFQVTTEVLFDEGPDTTVFVQLHGFSKLSGDPYVIMSNGTRITPQPDYIEVLKNELIKEDDVLTFKIIHQDLDWNRLTAFTNTQGRYINESSDPCKENATECSGRFVHIEQERSRLRADSAGWYTMYRALENTFPAISDPAGEYGREHTAFILFYPNPAIERLRIEAEGPFCYILFSSSGQSLVESSTDGNAAEVDLSNYAPGIYFIRVENTGGIRNGKIVVQ